MIINTQMSKTNDITTKNTKAEIVAAFEEMKHRFKQSEKNKLESPKNEVKQKEETKIVERSKSYTPDNLDNDILLLRKKIQAHLDHTLAKLTEESKKLHTIRKAAEIESKKLQEIYNIELAADTLKILITDYETKQKELSEQKNTQTLELEEAITSRRKEWTREQEEYRYNLKLEREREEEAYASEHARKKYEWEEKVSKKDVELSDREALISNQEQEIMEMRTRIERFPKKIESIINETKHKKEKQLKLEFSHERALLEQKWLAEKGIFEVNINNLEQTINNQKAETISLKQAVAEANQKAQNLAVTVVEGASLLNAKKVNDENKKDRENEKSDEHK